MLSAKGPLALQERFDWTRVDGRAGEKGESNVKAVRGPLHRSRGSATLSVPGRPKRKSWIKGLIHIES